MNQGAAIGLGAIAGATIFLGLPVARMHGLPKSVQGFLNAFATGILVFLLWDIVSHAAGPVEAAITQGHRGPFAAMAVIFAVGMAVGLLGLVYFNRTVFSHLRHDHPNPSARSLSLAIATGLGLHNLSEGLAIGESAVSACTTCPRGSRSGSRPTSARSPSRASSRSASRFTTSPRDSASRPR